MNIASDVIRHTHADSHSFALLRLEQTRLLVPQREIRVLDLAMDVARENPPYGGVGWIGFRQQQCPVYSPSPRLEWLSNVPADRSICALMEADEGIFGLLCTEIAIVKSTELTFHAIPVAMATPHSPITRLALYEGHLACLSSATQIFRHLPPLDRGEPVPFRNNQ